jgi:hypothetical protein
LKKEPKTYTGENAASSTLSAGKKAGCLNTVD